MNLVETSDFIQKLWQILHVYSLINIATLIFINY